jgi:hypothetical protein
MRLFQCQACDNIVYFENTSCERCHHRLGYLPESGIVSALEPSGDSWTAVGQSQKLRRFCANANHDGCNWLTPPDSADQYCVACRHNAIIPDLAKPDQLEAWRRMELAKHRLFYSLLRWNLPLRNKGEDPQHGLVFNFPAEALAAGAKVMTGHENGVITIALIEADDAEREKRRRDMGEPYRTLLGHFRHEIAHHYWDILVRDAGLLDACRAVFGDDRLDYQAALKSHYDRGAPPGWQNDFVSAYATTHPWEDFAETWAHYFHIVDTLEMASSFGMSVKPRLDTSGALGASIDFDPYEADDVQQIVGAWLPFVFAMNSVSRAIGRGDLYPFVLPTPVIAKLAFVHALIHGRLQSPRHVDASGR